MSSMISMSKKNMILICVMLLVYIIALVAFYATYEYTAYWEEETTIILRYSLLYLVIGLIIYFAFNWKAFNWKALSNASIKGITKIVAYASAIKAFLYICPFFLNQYFSSVFSLVYMAAWIAISAFFFTLYKNMK